MSDEDETSGAGKHIPFIVMTFAIGGFIALAWYAYNSGRQSMKEEDLLVIEAEKTPVKEKPLDPGGMKFPNQDKTIFETFASGQQQPKVERVLPRPEEPITKEEALEAMVSKKVEKVALPVKEERISFDDMTPAVTMKDSADEIVEDVKDVPVSQTKQVAEKPVAEKPSVETSVEKTLQKTSEHKEVKKVERKLFPVKIQLAAFASQKEAQDNWKKIQAKHSVLSGSSPLLVKADVKGKTFYRLRVGVAGKDDAKKMCGALTAKGQACIIASD